MSAPKGVHKWDERPPIDQLIVEHYQRELASGVSVEQAVDNIVASWVQVGVVSRQTYNRFRIKVSNAVENHNQAVFRELAVSSGLEELQ